MEKRMSRVSAFLYAAIWESPYQLNSGLKNTHEWWNMVKERCSTAADVDSQSDLFDLCVTDTANIWKFPRITADYAIFSTNY